MGMSRTDILAVFFVVLIWARGSCFSVGEIRRVLASEGVDNDDSASATPVPVVIGDKENVGPSKPDGGAKGTLPKTEQTTKPAPDGGAKGTSPKTEQTTKPVPDGGAEGTSPKTEERTKHVPDGGAKGTSPKKEETTKPAPVGGAKGASPKTEQATKPLLDGGADSTSPKTEETTKHVPDGGAKVVSPKTEQTSKPVPDGGAKGASPKTEQGTKPVSPLDGNTEGKDQSVDKDRHETPRGKTQDNVDCNVAAYHRCNDNHGLVACIRPDDSGQEHILLKNEGQEALTVKIKAPPSVNIGTDSVLLEKQQTKKVVVSLKGQDNHYIVLNAGHEDCSVQTGVPLSASTFFQSLPAYATQLTPIYGAYVLILTILIVGGVWACCKFGRKNRRGGDGVPYRELEMGLPQSTSAMDIDTVEGWDQGWDDDWEERPVDNTSEIRPVRSVSENGLSSRSIKKERWDNDWDD